MGWATGGPQKYTDRSMADAHKDLKTTPDGWTVFLDDFHQTMQKFGVPAAEEAELVAIINSTRGDIVVETAASSDL